MIYVLLGQTCSGKKEIAPQIAESIDAEIISVDSMKIYRGMDIGTAKASKNGRKKAHLIDILEPYENYNVAKFVGDCDKIIADIKARGKKPLLVVGTPLYLKALLYGIFSDLGSDKQVREEWEKTAQEKGLLFLYEQLRKIDPLKAGKIHPNDKKRIIRALEVHAVSGKPISSLQTHFNRNELRYKTVIAGLKWEPKELYKRIDERIERMFASGLVDEVRGLIKDKPLGKQAAQAVGYKEIIDYLDPVGSPFPNDFGNGMTPVGAITSNGVDKKITQEQAEEHVKKNTRYLARKQMTWFRGFPGVRWVECDNKPSRQIADEVIGIFANG